MVRKLTALTGALAVGGALAGLGLGATGTTPAAHTYKLSATLNARQEVPAAKGAAKASGTFTGTLKGTKLSYTLTYKGLTGKAAQAHIHTGKPGTSGPVVVPICPPRCASPIKGSATVNAKLLAKMKAGATYVNVHTAKNKGGEIRGLIKVR